MGIDWGEARPNSTKITQLQHFGDVMVDFSSAQCRAARGLLDWTQDHLAERAGVARSTIRGFEAGQHELHRGTQRQIVDALEAAGVLLLEAGEAGAGVRLRLPG